MAAEEEKKGLEILESSEALTEKISQTETFVQNNRQILSYVIGGVLVLIAAYFGYRYYIDEQETEAQKEMFPAVFYFESDSLNKALNGNKVNKGLLAIADEYSGTKAANQAKFYIGTIYLRQGKYNEAIEYLKDFSANDLLLQPRAYSLIGDAYLELNQADEAVSWYKKAVDTHPNKYFTPAYLYKLAIAQETAKDNEAAIASYNRIISEYGESTEAADAKKFLAILEAKSEK
jgi:tetratricopeptide (TPR) repeat protein